MITVLKPIRFISMVRNTGNSKQNPQTAKKWASNGGVGRYFIDKDRAQRNHVLLRDVAYIVNFVIKTEPHAKDSVGKYLAQFERRVNKGQCFKQPSFGCREYPAWFDWPSDNEQIHPELRGSFDLGMMPRRLQFVENSEGKNSWRNPITGEFVQGDVVPEFFHACLKDGVMEC